MTRSATWPTFYLRFVSIVLTFVFGVAACTPDPAGGPSITIPPADQTVAVGQDASFSVTAAGTALGYQWQRSTDGGAVFTDVAGAASATLTLTAVLQTDNGFQFRVVVSNSVGSVTSSAARLTVNAGQLAVPAFTIQPASVTLAAPSTATFSVAVTGSPTPTLQWQLNPGGLSQYTDIAGATASSYTTPATVVGDSGNQYRVIARNSSGTVVSAVATLTVNVPGVAPSFSTQPVNVTITEGQNAHFAVAASGTPTPTLQWQSSTDSGSSWSNIALATSATYDMTAVALTSNGHQFRAVATSSAGTVNSNAAVLTVNAQTAKAFGTAALAETDLGGAAAQPQIAVDASGNALAVWVRSDATFLNIWSNRYTASTNTWGTAAPIETGAGFSSHPQVAIDASGNGLAVWQQSDGTRDNIWSNRYTAGAGWGTAALIETDDAGGAANPQIAFDAAANALAVWEQSDGTHNRIWSNRYTAGTGWGAGAAIVDVGGISAHAPQFAIDATGYALVVWSNYTGTGNNIVANRYTPGTGWGADVIIGSDTLGFGDIHLAQIAFDSAGNALAVWGQSDGTRRNIMANRYTAGTGWGTAALIEFNNAGDASQPQIAFDASGNALAVWLQFDGTRDRVWSNRYTAGTGWGGFPAIIQTDSVGGSTATAQAPQIAIDANGNALAVWAQPSGASDATYDIWVNRYAAGSGWGTTATLAQIQINIAGGAGENAAVPQIAFDPNGNAIVAWTQSDGTSDSVWFNRFH